MSKLLMFEWECPTHGVFDDLKHSSVHATPCPKCQKVSKRLISTPRLDYKNMGLDAAAFPTAGAKWAKKHEQARKIDERNATDNGPSAWGADGADVRR